MQTRFLVAKPTSQQMLRLPTRGLPLTRAEPIINPSIEKESKKVVTTINVAELDKKVECTKAADSTVLSFAVFFLQGVFCRCWRSGTVNYYSCPNH